MPTYEYRVIPAPQRGEKGKGVGRDTASRFAHALEVEMNAMGAEGWDYVRTDTLPCEERTGLTGRTTSYQNMLVFRRRRSEAADLAPRILTPAPVLMAPAPLALVPPTAPQVAAE